MKSYDVTLPNLEGEHYYASLDRLHKLLKPTTYLEIGTASGHSLALARCRSLSIDPQYRIFAENLGGIFDKPAVHFFQEPSDQFFANNDPEAILGGAVELAFLDGMHHCEFLLRDFINTEKICASDGVILLHDCLPVEAAIADRDYRSRPTIVPERKDWWAGDVWRTSRLLMKRRPDLKFTVVDASPTGLVIISNLDPKNSFLKENYEECCAEMMSWNLEEIGIGVLHQEMAVQSTEILLDWR